MTRPIYFPKIAGVKGDEWLKRGCRTFDFSYSNAGDGTKFNCYFNDATSYCHGAGVTLRDIGHLIGPLLICSADLLRSVPSGLCLETRRWKIKFSRDLNDGDLDVRARCVEMIAVLGRAGSRGAGTLAAARHLEAVLSVWLKLQPWPYGSEGTS